MNADEIIRLLRLEPLLPEGGYFRQTYIRKEWAQSGIAPGLQYSRRPLCTAIYFLLTSERGCFSALHRLPSDEIYHIYLGDPVDMLLLYPDGTSQVLQLGQDLCAGQQVQFVVPAGVWQASILVEGGEFALLGTTMAPGYLPEDYDPANPADLVDQYPDRVNWIHQLTSQSHR